jgi:hypothetical protein
MLIVGNPYPIMMNIPLFRNLLNGAPESTLKTLLAS